MPASDEEGDDDAMRRLRLRALVRQVSCAGPGSCLWAPLLFGSEDAARGGGLAALLGALYISPRGSCGEVHLLLQNASARVATQDGPLFTPARYTLKYRVAHAEALSCARKINVQDIEDAAPWRK